MRLGSHSQSAPGAEAQGREGAQGGITVMMTYKLDWIVFVDDLYDIPLLLAWVAYGVLAREYSTFFYEFTRFCYGFFRIPDS